VTFGDAQGRLRSIAHAPRTDPPELALGPCIEHCGEGAAAAVAFCDEAVPWGKPPPDDLALRFAMAKLIAHDHGIHLVDWIACDDRVFRSTKWALQPGAEWWDVPC
jgi:hypothetical protein